MDRLDIPHGFSFDKAKTLDAAYAALPGIRSVVIAAAEQQTFQTVTDLATRLYDFATVFPTKQKPTYSWLRQARDILSHRLQSSHEKKEESPLDLGCAIGLVKVEKRVIGFFLTTAPQLWNALMTAPDVIPYTYSSLTDRPKNITAKRWEQRRIDWEFDPTSPMLRMDLIPRYYMPMPAVPLAHNVIPYETRLHTLADEVTIGECKSEFGLQNFNDIAKFVTGNSEYARRLTERKAAFAELLDKEITLDKLQETQNGPTRISEVSPTY